MVGGVGGGSLSASVHQMGSLEASAPLTDTARVILKQVGFAIGYAASWWIFAFQPVQSSVCLSFSCVLYRSPEQITECLSHTQPF